MILMLGDSLTQWGNFSKLLERDDIINQGVSGDTSYDVLSRLPYILENVSLVKFAFLMFGINDIFSGYNTNEIFKNYTNIIKEVQEKKIKVIIQSVVFASAEILGVESINLQVSKLNSLLIEYCKKNSLEFIDLNDNILSSNSLLKDEATTDGVHFSNKGYELWGTKLKSFMQENNI